MDYKNSLLLSLDPEIKKKKKVLFFWGFFCSFSLLTSIQIKEQTDKSQSLVTKNPTLQFCTLYSTLLLWGLTLTKLVGKRDKNIFKNFFHLLLSQNIFYLFISNLPVSARKQWQNHGGSRSSVLCHVKIFYCAQFYTQFNLCRRKTIHKATRLSWGLEPD